MQDEDDFHTGKEAAWTGVFELKVSEDDASRRGCLM